jgi:hypothetical protein
MSHKSKQSCHKSCPFPVILRSVTTTSAAGNITRVITNVGITTIPIPAGFRFADVEAVGAGGGASAGNTFSSGAGGAGAGDAFGNSIPINPLTPPITVNITGGPGLGGLNGTNLTQNGMTGGNCTVTLGVAVFTGSGGGGGLAGTLGVNSQGGTGGSANAMEGGTAGGLGGITQGAPGTDGKADPGRFSGAGAGAGVLLADIAPPNGGNGGNIAAAMGGLGGISVVGNPGPGGGGASALNNGANAPPIPGPGVNAIGVGAGGSGGRTTLLIPSAAGGNGAPARATITFRKI